MREFVVLVECRWIATEEFAEKLDLGTAGLRAYVRTVYFASLGLIFNLNLSHGLRRGLHSYAASRLTPYRSVETLPTKIRVLSTNLRPLQLEAIATEGTRAHRRLPANSRPR